MFPSPNVIWMTKSVRLNGGACSTHERNERCIKHFVERPERKKLLEIRGRWFVDWLCVVQLVSSYKHDNESSSPPNLDSFLSSISKIVLLHGVGYELRAWRQVRRRRRRRPSRTDFLSCSTLYPKAQISIQGRLHSLTFCVITSCSCKGRRKPTFHYRRHNWLPALKGRKQAWLNACTSIGYNFWPVHKFTGWSRTDFNRHNSTCEYTWIAELIYIVNLMTFHVLAIRVM